MGNFLKDLKKSQLGVAVVKKYLEENLNLPIKNTATVTIRELEKSEQHLGDLHVKISDNGITVLSNIEVKYDIMAAQTGNLCFEVSKGDKPTGIMKTEADYVYYVVPVEEGWRIYMFHLEELKEYITTSPKAKLKRGGDGKKFSMYIVAIQDIIEDTVAYQLGTVLNA